MKITKQTTLGELLRLMPERHFVRIQKEGDWTLRENWLDKLVEGGLLKDAPDPPEAVKISPEQEEKLKAAYMEAFNFSSSYGAYPSDGAKLEGIQQAMDLLGINYWDWHK